MILFPGNCINILFRQTIHELLVAQNTDKAAVRCGSQKDKMPNKRLMKRKSPNKIAKNSLENYLIRRPMNM